MTFAYPLVIYHSYRKSPSLLGKLTISMAMVHYFFPVLRSSTPHLDFVHVHRIHRLRLAEDGRDGVKAPAEAWEEAAAVDASVLHPGWIC